ncbi:MAG: leucyl aminopeptidase [Planctomycetota bacterium]|nr:leucyl aminopeptidase [Planctomycetota bacterium]
MKISLSSASWHDVQCNWLIVGVAESPELSGPVEKLDLALGGTISRLIESGDLTGKLAKLLPLHDVPGISSDRVLLVGLGNIDGLTRARFEKAMMTAVRKASSKDGMTVAICVPEAVTKAVGSATAIETTATAAIVGSQGQDSLKSEQGHFPMVSVSLLVEGAESQAATDAAARGTTIGEAINLTRELVNLPPEMIYPESFAARARAVADELGLRFEALGQDELEAERMGALLAVSQGSTRPPRVVAIRYQGGAADAPTLAIVGKGVTFDSGGLSLKPSESMITMKCDMAGAATALGAVSAIARLKLPVNVVGYMGLVENMVSGTSYKLGDILTARNGVTIEVQNTDAEGRLVLADVLSFAVEKGADRIVDLATLTGACVVALGEEVTGAFTNNQDWCDGITDAAAVAGEEIWQMPMFDHFEELLKSDVADCRNIGGRWGGAISAAKFLEKFVEGKPWVHLDIAGPSFASSNTPHREGGATGCMVRTLVEAAAALAR